MTRRRTSDRLSSVQNVLQSVPIGEPIAVSQDKLTHRVAAWFDTDKILYGQGNCAKPELKAQTVCGIITNRMRFTESLNDDRCPICWPRAVDQVPKKPPHLYVVQGHRTDENIPF